MVRTIYQYFNRLDEACGKFSNILILERTNAFNFKPFLGNLSFIIPKIFLHAIHDSPCTISSFPIRFICHFPPFCLFFDILRSYDKRMNE